MTTTKPKKSLGQNFLHDKNIAYNIVNALSFDHKYTTIVEIGPGRGALTTFLVEKKSHMLFLVEIDGTLVADLKKTYPNLCPNIIEADFLQLKLAQLGNGQPMAIIGNFPYHLASQIFFKILTYRCQVQEVVCMIQKEVAERITAPPGCKAYGILSVLLQAFYHIEYLFTVNSQVFTPRPKVTSAVIRLRKNPVQQLACDEILFFKLVKAGFQQRRKMLRNAVQHFILPTALAKVDILAKRAEQLTVQDFVGLTQKITQGDNS